MTGTTDPQVPHAYDHPTPLSAAASIGFLSASVSLLAETTSHGLVIASMEDDRVIAVNDTFLRMTGRSRADTVDRPLTWLRSHLTNSPPLHRAVTLLDDSRRPGLALTLMLQRDRDAQTRSRYRDIDTTVSLICAHTPVTVETLRLILKLLAIEMEWNAAALWTRRGRRHELDYLWHRTGTTTEELKLMLTSNRRTFRSQGRITRLPIGPRTRPTASMVFLRSDDRMPDAELRSLLDSVSSHLDTSTGADATTAAKLARVHHEYRRARHDYTQLVRHRLMNPLTIIKGAALTLVEDPSLESPARDLIRSIVTAAERIEHLSLDPNIEHPSESELEPYPQLDER